MGIRVWFTNLLLTAGAALLIAAIFLPGVCFFVITGGAIQGGCTSVWGISPFFSSLIIFFITTAAGTAMWRQNDELSSALLTTGSSSGSLGVTHSPLSQL